jgi:hypothetical protein
MFLASQLMSATARPVMDFAWAKAKQNVILSVLSVVQNLNWWVSSTVAKTVGDSTSGSSE